jgi:hypothetical protein
MPDWNARRTGKDDELKSIKLANHEALIW